jgi:hypothetical protein
MAGFCEHDNEKAGNFLRSWLIISFARMAPLHTAGWPMFNGRCASRLGQVRKWSIGWYRRQVVREDENKTKGMA